MEGWYLFLWRFAVRLAFIFFFGVGCLWFISQTFRAL